MSEMAEAIRELTEEKGISIESIKISLEKTIVAAYKKTFGREANNCIVKFEDDMSDVNVFSRKTVVDGVYDPVTEIELEEALKLTDQCEIGDEIDIRVDPKSFERAAVGAGKSTARQELKESFKNSLYDEYKGRLGTLVTGKFQRMKNDNIYLDIDSGRVEGVLPKKYQNPREDFYGADSLIKGVVVELNRKGPSLQLVLSRTDPNFVRSILENEVPELKDGTVEIYKIVREAGYRTKLAVSSGLSEVDPVGACVGQKGQRIQKVIMELDGEKIDVLKYDADPVVFIRNALSPAEVSKVFILDEDKKQALAIVPDSQLSLAIGKQGQNVRLANRLCDWSIDVKTESQAAELDLSEITSRKAQSLFENGAEEESADTVSSLPGVDEKTAQILKDAGYDDIQTFVDNYDSGALYNVEGLTKEDVDSVYEIISENVEIVEAENNSDSAEDSAEEEYFCPECGAKITLDMKKCPECGVEFEFEEGE